MSKVRVVRRCFNCGAVLQNEDEKKEGYVKDATNLSAPLNQILFCDKCFSESFISSPNPLKAGNDFLLMMKDAAASQALIVYIVNLFSFEASFVKEINQIIKCNPILVVANKRDLFGKEISDDFLKEYVAHRFRIAMLPITSSDVMLTSLVSFGSNNSLIEEIEKRRRGHDVYVISSQGAGKSLFFSSFLYHFKNRSNRSVETKAPRGTSSPIIQIPLDNSSTLFDTPTIPSYNSISNKLDKDIADSLLFSSPTKCRRLVMKRHELLALGGICFVEFKDGENEEKGNEIHLFVPPALTIKKINFVGDFDSVLSSFLFKKGVYPKSGTIRDLKDFDVLDIEVEETGDRTIGIEGLGWFSFLGNHQVFRLYVPKGVSVYTSRSKILSYGNCPKK